MSETKQIKFQFVVDENSARSVNRVLDDMIRKAQELGKAMAGVAGQGIMGGAKVGGGAPSPQSTLAGKGGTAAASGGGKASFTSVLTANADGFKRLASEGGAAMKVMADALHRGIGAQQNDLKALDKTIADLAKRYQELGIAQARSVSQGMKAGDAERLYGGERERIQEKLLEAGTKRGDVAAEGQKLHALAKEQRLRASGFSSEAEAEAFDRHAAGIDSRSPDEIAAGIGGRKAALKGMLGKLKPSGIGSVGAGIAGALAVANFGLDESLAGNRSYASEEGKRGQLVESKIRQMHAGDTRWLFNLKMQQRDADARKDLEAQTSGVAANAEQIRAGVGQFAGSIPVVGGIARAIGLVGPDTGGGALGGFTTAHQQSNMAENAFKQLDEKAKGTAMLYANMAQESFQGRMAQSIQMQRIMGVGGLQQKKGAGDRVYENQAGDLITKLEGQGYTAGEYLGAFQGLRSSAGGKFAGRNAWTAMAAQAQGYGGFSELMGASARLGQGKTLAMGALGGGIDKAAGIQLGQGVLGQGFDVRGTTSGYGALAAAQAGMGFTGASSDFNKVQQAVAGLQYGSTITQGGVDSYQQGRNLISAIGLNASGSSYSQDFLANGMSMKQMLDMANGGKMTETAKALGLTPDKIKEQLGESMGSVFDRFVDEGKNDPMSKAIRGYQASGMGYGDYLKKLRKEGDVDTIKTLGASSALLTGGDEEAGVGAARILSGQGEKLKSGKIGGGVGGAEKTSLAAQEELQKKIDASLKVIGKDLEDTIKAMPEATKKLANFGENLSQEAGDMMKALADLTDSFNKAAVAFDPSKAKQQPGKPGAPAASKAVPKK
jgi:hypothetical protein